MRSVSGNAVYEVRGLFEKSAALAYSWRLLSRSTGPLAGLRRSGKPTVAGILAGLITGMVIGTTRGTRPRGDGSALAQLLLSPKCCLLGRFSWRIQGARIGGVLLLLPRES